MTSIEINKELICLYNAKELYALNTPTSPIDDDDYSSSSSNRSSFNRVEYLEEKVKNNQFVIQKMNQSITDFLSNRKPIQIQESNKLELLNNFIQIVFTQDMKKIIEFINGVTDDKGTNKDLKNVLVDTIQNEFNNQQKDTNEMEQVIEEMRTEMENMIEEINEIKQQKHTTTVNTHTNENHTSLMDTTATTNNNTNTNTNNDNNDTTNDTLSNLPTQNLSHLKTVYDQQITALKNEKEELRKRLIKAETKWIQSEKALNESQQLQNVLQVTIAKKDGEVAKINAEFEKLKTKHDQLNIMNESKLKNEIQTRLDDLESSLKLDYKKQFDVFQINTTKEVRLLSNQIADLEYEIENLETQHIQDLQILDNIKHQYKLIDQKLISKQSDWDQKEADFKHIILNNDQKIISLEKEVLLLYSKNLELVNSLGELDDDN